MSVTVPIARQAPLTQKYKKQQDLNAEKAKVLSLAFPAGFWLALVIFMLLLNRT